MVHVYECPNCGAANSSVKDSRPTDDTVIRRRRVCLNCHHNYTTYEIHKEDYDRLRALNALLT